jgi:DHA2 family methylenomycin A resistance protein-like MFS transporter
MISRQSPSFAYALVVVTTSLGFVVVQLDVSVVNVALTRIGAALSMGVGGPQWLVDAYALAFAALLLTGGALGDRIGARRVFIGGMALFTVASLACGLSQNAGTLIAARAVQGIGAAMLMPCSLALLNHASGGVARRRASGVSIWTAAGGAALAGGPALGGLMVDRLGWASIFLVNVPIGIVAIALALLCLDETPVKQEQTPIDVAGQILAILAPLSLTAAIIEGGALGFSSPVVLAGLMTAACLAVAFVRVERKSGAPLLPLDLFRNTAFAVANFVGLAVNLTTYGMIFVLSFYFQEAKHYSPQATGAAFAPFLAMVIVSNMAAGPIVTRIGTRKPMMIGLSMAVVGFLLLLEADTQTSYPSLIWRLLVLTAGSGLAVPAMTTAVLSAAPAGMAGVASGVLNTVRQTSGAIGVALFGALMSLGIVPGLRVALIVSAALMALAAASVALLRQAEA